MVDAEFNCDLSKGFHLIDEMTADAQNVVAETEQWNESVETYELAVNIGDINEPLYIAEVDVEVEGVAAENEEPSTPSDNEGILHETDEAKPESNEIPEQVVVEQVTVPEAKEEEKVADGKISEEEEEEEEDVPLIRLVKNLDNLDHACSTPHPYASVRSRLRSGSPFQIHSEPVSPRDFTFPALRKAEGQFSLVQEPERKRPREDEPSDEPPTAKRTCTRWDRFNWFKWYSTPSDGETSAQPNTRRCAIM